MPSSSFDFIADHLALDFANTRALRSGSAVDWLASPDRVATWLHQAGLATAEDLDRLGASPPEARVLFEEALRFRDVTSAVVERFSRGAPIPEGSLELVNRCLEASPSVRRAEVDEQGYSVRDHRCPKGSRGIVAPLAEALALLLAEGDPNRVRRCGNEGCGLWFYDVSKNGSRRWCSMSRCGNRAKAATHYRRKKAREQGLT
jgi:predicted RNA-binding Zn ribbon-like protein